MSELPAAVKGLEHYTPEMHIAFNDTLSAINRAENRWTRFLYPDDDNAVPYPDTPAPTRRRRFW